MIRYFCDSCNKELGDKAPDHKYKIGKVEITVEAEKPATGSRELVTAAHICRECICQALVGGPDSA